MWSTHSLALWSTSSPLHLSLNLLDPMLLPYIYNTRMTVKESTLSFCGYVPSVKFLWSSPASSSFNFYNFYKFPCVLNAYKGSIIKGRWEGSAHFGVLPFAVLPNGIVPMTDVTLDFSLPFTKFHS